jgi:ribosomal protein S18 acetylase RimI-like enzyme
MPTVLTVNGSVALGAQAFDMIRQAELTDVESLQSLSEVLGYPYPLEKFKANLATSLADDKQVILAAVANQKVVGYCHAEFYEPLYSDKLLNVLGLVVAENQQGQGIGGQLLTGLENFAKTHNISAIRLNSGEDRHAAHHFYEKNGYISLKDQKNFRKMLATKGQEKNG